MHVMWMFVARSLSPFVDSAPPVVASAASISPASVAILLVALVALWSSSTTAVVVGCIMLLPLTVLGVPPALFYCGRGTLLITYPPVRRAPCAPHHTHTHTHTPALGSGPVFLTVVVSGAQGGVINVNNLPVPTCSALGPAQSTVNLTAWTPLTPGDTFWFASPTVLDIDLNGSPPETIVCGASCKVSEVN